MNNNFKRMFLSSLLSVLFIVSNLIGQKYTNFMGLTLSVSFLLYPFVYLCILLILNTFGRKEALESIVVTVFIQIFILLGYVMAVNLGSQAIIPDMALEVNTLFRVDEIQIMSSIIGFLISGYILIYIYEYMQIIGYKLLGVVCSVLSSIILYGLITITINMYAYGGLNMILEMILCHIIMAVIITIVITIIFYILKDRDNFYKKSNVFIKDVNLDMDKKNKISDKTIEEVMDMRKKKDDKKTNKRQKKVNKSKNKEKK